MKPFIEWNTKLRTAAKNDFEKELFKAGKQRCLREKQWRMLETELT